MVDGRRQTPDLWTEQTQQAFDAAAPVYDLLYEGLHGIHRMRRITFGLFLEYFTPGANLLEINCGTGNDAIALAKRGMHILATDLSAQMLAEAARKTSAEGLDRSIDFQQLSFDDLPDLRGHLFDGVYSNLGGLNCTNRLPQVAAALAELIRPGGYLIAVVMPSFCLWESVAFLARFRWKEAGRRLSRYGTAAHVHGGSVQTFYHSPRQFRKACAPFFDHVETLGLSVLVPPPNFERSYATLGKAIHWLDRVDDLCSKIPVCRAMGDHYAIVLRRSQV